MGMESYNLLFLHENSRIVRERELWKLSGTSDLSVNGIRSQLAETCKQTTETEWIFDECIDILVYQEDGWFQGLELRGCLAYFDKGIEQCYACYNLWSQTIPLRIYIMNQQVQVTDFGEFRDLVAEVYAEKIKWFQRNYGNIEWKVTSDAFYQEVRKRQSWWYRLGRCFHGEK